MAYIFDGIYCGYRTYTRRGAGSTGRVAISQLRTVEPSYRTPVSLAAWTVVVVPSPLLLPLLPRILQPDLRWYNGHAHAAAAWIQFRRPHQCVQCTHTWSSYSLATRSLNATVYFLYSRQKRLFHSAKRATLCWMYIKCWASIPPPTGNCHHPHMAISNEGQIFVRAGSRFPRINYVGAEGVSVCDFIHPNRMDCPFRVGLGDTSEMERE